jgi:hypothetical protein
MESINDKQLGDLFITMFLDFDFCLPTIRQFKDEVKYHRENTDMDTIYHKVVNKTIHRYKTLYRCVLNEDREGLAELGSVIPNPFVELIMFWILAGCMVRDKRSGALMYDCEGMLEFIEKQLEDEKINEGEYLDFCNNLKLMKSLQDVMYIEQLDDCEIILENDFNE